MSELVGWLIVVGLAAAIVCIFLLSSQLEEHMRNTAKMMLWSNEMILARLERLAGPSLEPPEPAVGVVLERRNVSRKDPLTRLAGGVSPNDLPRRRLDDVRPA
jgi:uncharacterized membrane protein YdfJ with MMPL/SSD domain